MIHQEQDSLFALIWSLSSATTLRPKMSNNPRQVNLWGTDCCDICFILYTEKLMLLQWVISYEELIWSSHLVTCIWFSMCPFPVSNHKYMVITLITYFFAHIHATGHIPWNSRKIHERTWHQVGGICHKTNNGYFTSTMHLSYRPQSTAWHSNKALFQLWLLSERTRKLNAESSTHMLHTVTRIVETPIITHSLI